MAVGTGDLAKAFAKLYLNSCKKEGSLYEVVAVEPLDIDVGERLIVCVPVVDDKLAAYQSADLLLLAIPARALRSFLQNTFDKFGADEILLDCTNPCGHHDLKWALEDLAIGSDRWIKGLNDNGAVALLQEKPDNKFKLHTKIYGPNDEVVAVVKKTVADVFGLGTFTSISQTIIHRAWKLKTTLALLVQTPKSFRSTNIKI